MASIFSDSREHKGVNEVCRPSLLPGAHSVQRWEMRSFGSGLAGQACMGSSSAEVLSGHAGVVRSLVEARAVLQLLE